MSFNKKLAAAKKVPRPFEDVTVALRADVADARAELDARREDLEARFAKAQRDAVADQRLTSSGPDTEGFSEEFVALSEAELELDRQEADSLVTLRFWELPGPDWAEITVKHPARQGVIVDMPYGYDLHGATREAAETDGRVVEDGKLIAPSEAQWGELWDQLPGRSFGAVADAIYRLNEYGPEQRVERLKKASRPPLDVSSD